MRIIQDAGSPAMRARHRHTALVALLSVLIGSPLIAQEGSGEAAAEPSVPVAAGEGDTAPAETRAELAPVEADVQALAERVRHLERRIEAAEAARDEAGKAKSKAEAAREQAEQALAKVEEAKAEAERELTRRAQEVLTLKEDLERAHDENAALERRLVQVQDLKRENREREEALSALEAQRNALEERLAALEETRKEEARQVAERETALRKTLTEQEERIVALRSRLPASEGGTLSVEDATTRAAEAGAALKQTQRSTGSRNTPEQRQAIREAETRLFQAQMLLSRALGAQGLYRVAPGDTLARVSQRVYGDGGRWKAIYEANAHIIGDPDLVSPGVTLVIPE